MTDKAAETEFLHLLQEHQGLLHKVCRVYATREAEKEDLFQEMVVQLWKAYGSFRGEAKFSTWMYRIALNTAISAIRKKDSRVQLSFPEFVPRDLADEKHDELAEERRSNLYRAIGQLTELEKAIVMLYLEDKSYDEMQDILGINSGNLRVKMTRIKDKLRQLTNAVPYGTR
ncbi:MAG TPA: sigma-70 family RNA polymerase sigma factor [Lacibacter sp.]|nr:sigma-70 family RNA polymerase sigma factor [Lacibacter sp.]HMO88312.1 sigma-70 family RNA polymerase sigma factor [Lacibacter sp.]HMP87689.1 sigma-70 family RNA polymerase sigma factor [Lacibacter sp.]